MKPEGAAKAAKVVEASEVAEGENEGSELSPFQTAELMKALSTGSKGKLSEEEMTKLMENNPELLAAVQDKLQGLMDDKFGYIESLPKPVRNRINALKNLQVECAKIEGKFYEEAHELEMKYAQLFKPLYEKRNQVINALYEPTEEECRFVDPTAADDEEEDEEDESKKEKMVNGDEKVADGVADQMDEKLKLDEDAKGIPSFWLTAMNNVDTIQDMIQEHDQDILKHLTDIQLSFTSKLNGDENMGFILQFIFAPNEYFTNTTLTKTYVMKSEPEETDPFSFDGPDIVACTGCEIEWNKGKNVTEKVVKKKQKHKGKGQTRIVSKTVKNDSFFNFFNPPEVTAEDEEDMDDDLQALLESDFEIGHFFREQLIPKAVLFFTGEAIEEDSDDEDDDSYDEDDDADDDDDDDDDNGPQQAAGEKPEECKQQ